MPPTTSPLAILFADVSGSTRLYDTLGDQEALRKIGHCLGLLGGIALREHGTVIKTIGDEILCAFPDAGSAVTAAMGMQQALIEESGPLRIRIGLHYGEVIRDAGDVFGDAVNLAARMTELAVADQIITTRATVDCLPPQYRTNIRHLGQTAVKGKREAVQICEVIWHNSSDMTLMPTMLPGMAARTTHIGIMLTHAGRELILSGVKPSASVGRETDNDLVVNDPMASRHHARVELRNAKFVLIDQSTNGTYVTQGDRTLFLHREELPLAGAGYFVLGHKSPSHVPEAVHYSCQY